MRIFTASDMPAHYRGLVFAKWMRSLRFGNDYYRLMDQFSYYKSYQRLLASIMANPSTMITLALLTDDPDVVLGFAVTRGNILDYVYVDKDQRRQGIARAIVHKHIGVITHLTRTGISIWDGKYGHIIFDPFR